MLYYTILYYTILYYTILYYTILYYTILHYTILYYIILYYIILYYIILYYIILYPSTVPHALKVRSGTSPLPFTGWWSRNSSPFTEPEGSLLTFLKPSANPCSESDKFGHLSDECCIPSPSHLPNNNT
jgi:hypothetical protein